MSPDWLGSPGVQLVRTGRVKALLPVVIALSLLTGCRLMALPESQRAACAGTVHGWHRERLADIAGLQVPNGIKAEMADFSSQTEVRQLKEVCDINELQITRIESEVKR